MHRLCPLFTFRRIIFPAQMPADFSVNEAKCKLRLHQLLSYLLPLLLVGDNLTASLRPHGTNEADDGNGKSSDGDSYRGPVGWHLNLP
jgi:hypothetical protein